MRSRARALGNHPIHPMLIPFPIAFLTGTFACDIVAKLSDSTDSAMIAYYLAIAGVMSGLIAAIPGMVDYAETVPPRSSGKKYAAIHMSANVIVLLIFAGTWFLRNSSDDILAWFPVFLELCGIGLLMFSGWLGGQLGFRYQIGVEHKYANGGDWNEIGIEETFGNTIPVARPDELEANQMKLIHWRNRRIVLARTETGYVAYDDRCSHQGGSLADGATMRSCVQCPWHGSQFDAISGQVQSGPATRPISTYEVHETATQIELVISDIEKKEAA